MKTCALLITGRFYGTCNKEYLFFNNLENLNQDYKFEVYVQCWEFDHKNARKYRNNIEEIIDFFNVKEIIVENYEDVNGRENFNSSFEIMVYNRKKVSTLIKNKKYDCVILSRPDLIWINNLRISELVLTNDSIYSYKCPSHARHICYDFCDWVLITNNDTMKKINDIKYQIKISCSNERNFKNNYLKNKIKINILGEVDKNIKQKYANFL